MNNYSILLIMAIICHSSTINPDIKFPNCENNKGEEVMEGNDFIPPDDECIHCLCYKGEAKFCATIRCDKPPPLDCKKWTEVCCNYTCHDGEFNEMDEVNADHPYDSPENTAYNHLKYYAGELWNRIIHGKKTLITVGPTNIPVFEDTTISSERSTTLSDIPEEIPVPSLNDQISSERSTPLSDIPEEIPVPSLNDQISSERSTTLSDIPEEIPLPSQNDQIPKIVKDEKPKLHNARNCLDVYDIEAEEGQFYIPGPSTCLMCRCINGRSRFCRTMECDTQPPKDCIDWTQDCCEYTCNDTKDPKANFFFNRWVDNWFRKTTITPPKDPYNEDPL